MKSKSHPKTQNVKFLCSSCKSQFEVLTTIKQPSVNIEVCSNCHPFYLGKNTGGKISGRAEKLLHKFETGKASLETAPVKKTNETRVKKVKKQTLADLAK